MIFGLELLLFKLDLSGLPLLKRIRPHASSWSDDIDIESPGECGRRGERGKAGVLAVRGTCGRDGCPVFAFAVALAVVVVD